jgi:hypothetical protein
VIAQHPTGNLLLEERLQVRRPDPDRVHDPNVRQLTAVAQPVDGRVTYAQVLCNLGHLEQPIAPAPEDPQVGERGRHAGPLSRLRGRRGPLPLPRRRRATVRECGRRLGYQMGTKTFRKACGQLRIAGLWARVGM